MKNSEVKIRVVRNKTDRQLFCEINSICMMGDKFWVPPLKEIVLNQINPNKNSWFQNGEAQFFIAEINNKPVGRLSVQLDYNHLNLHQDSTGFFGFFDSIDNQEVVNELFKKAFEWLKYKKIRKVRGPFSLNINQESGLLIDGFESSQRMMMGHAKPYYEKLILGLGFSKVKDLYAYLTPMDTAIPYKYRHILERFISRNSGLTFRHLDMKKYDRDIRIIVDLFNQAWKDNWGFIPMTDADAKNMAKELKPIIIPELVWFAFVDDKPAAMAVALPDLNEMISDLGGRLLPLNWIKLIWRIINRRTWSSRTRIPLMGVAPEFKNKTMGSILALIVIGSIREASLKLNLPICEMSWVLEDNRSTRHSLESIGARIYKTYRVYEKEI